MIFTQEQIDEIEQKLTKRGAKDTQLPSAKTPLTGDESIAIVQERENRLVPIGSIVNTDGGIFNVSEYLKAKTEVPTSVILTLSEAIEACPSRVKKAGQIITFIDKDKEWQRYQYQGYNVENWNQLTLWKDLNNISEDIPVSEDVMVFNITEYMPGGSKSTQAIWAGIYTIDGITPVSQYRLIFGCDASLGIVEGVDMDASDTLAIIDIDTDKVATFSYILFVGNSIDGYRYQTTINSYEDVPDWIEEAFGNNSSYILANIASLERRVNTKLDNKVNKVQGKGLSTNDFTNTNVSELASSINSVSYNSSTKKIIFTKNNSDTVEIDATDFVKDGMVSDVSIVGTNLVITFNTDSGKEDIEIPLTDIFNPANYYTKAQVDTALSSKQDTINDLATIRSGAALGATAVQTETDPTVPSWAKQQSKPTYTAAEVGALPVGTTSISDLSDGTRVDDIEDALEEKANKIPMPDVVHELVVEGTSQVSDVINLITGRFEEYPAESIQIFGTFKNPSIIEFSVNYTGKLRFEGIRESVILKYIKAYVNGTLVETSTERIIDSEILSFNVEANDVVKVEFTIYNNTDYFHGCIGDLSITSAGVPKDLVDVYNDLENKVDKVSGKGLSTNDYTTEEKTKLSALPTNSELTTLLNSKVDKVNGKGLSTEDYTPTEKTKLSDLPTATELTQVLGSKANTADLASVATSGSYNDLSDKPTLDDLNKVEDLYALDATNSDWKTKVDKMFDDGTLPTISKSFDYCNLRIYKKYVSGVEADTTAINSLETTEEGLTFADGTHFSSYKIGEKYYVGYLTGFFINNESTVLGNIEITSTKKGTIKLYLYKCTVREDAYFQINGQITSVKVPTTEAATILTFDVNEGDIISVSPTEANYYRYIGLVGMSFYSKYPVSRFSNDAGYVAKSVDNLVNYYLKSETYTKTEVQQLIGAIQQFHYEVYPTLPQTGASNVLYLIGPTGSGSDKYEEYVYANNDWTKIGDTSIDLSGYVTTEALTTALADYVTSSALSVLLANYYNKTEVDGLFAGKENVMPITTATGATLSAVVGNYYRLDNVGTLAITLPTITGATKLQAITFLLICGSNTVVTFVPQGSETILYQENFPLQANTTYEVTALWNGSEWTLSRVIYE